MLAHRDALRRYRMLPAPRRRLWLCLLVSYLTLASYFDSLGRRAVFAAYRADSITRSGIDRPLARPHTFSAVTRYGDRPCYSPCSRARRRGAARQLDVFV